MLSVAAKGLSISCARVVSNAVKHKKQNTFWARLRTGDFSDPPIAALGGKFRLNLGKGKDHVLCHKGVPTAE